MGRFERHLQIGRDTNRPVKAVSITCVATVFFHQRHRFFHQTSDFRCIVNDNAIVATRIFPQRVHDKFVQHAEVIGALFWPGQDQWQNLIFVGRIHQDTQQIQQLFCCPYATREDDNTVGDTHERFQTFFNVRHDDQFVYQRVRRFRRDN